MDMNKFNCVVCSELTDSNYYYGVMSCRSCRVFFRRKILQIHKEKCFGTGNCEITERSRTFCGACRFEKCLAVGMKPEKIKKGVKQKSEVNCMKHTP